MYQDRSTKHLTMKRVYAHPRRWKSFGAGARLPVLHRPGEGHSGGFEWRHHSGSLEPLL